MLTEGLTKSLVKAYSDDARRPVGGPPPPVPVAPLPPKMRLRCDWCGPVDNGHTSLMCRLAQWLS